MTDLSAPFAPDWVSPPGETILDLIEERGWTQAELATRMDYTEKHISQLINGKVSLSDETAQRLERVLGSNIAFWLNREAKYRERCARLAVILKYTEWEPWLEELPVKELMSAAVINKRPISAKSKPELIEACLQFFGVVSPEQWRKHYGGMQVAFRRTSAEQNNLGAISAWLRMGEQQAEQQTIPKYDRKQFNTALKEIRQLTTETPAVFEPHMRQLLQQAGVIFVLVPAIPRAHVSGIARWLSPTRPLIQLSLCGKTNDRFWFTFFHEAAHILLHDKKLVFLDDPSAGHSDDPKEHEANQWARDFLIPPDYLNELPNLSSKTAVTAFAQKLGIHPSIVIGRLQHDKLIEPTWINRLDES